MFAILLLILNVCILGKFLGIKHGMRFRIKQENCCINVVSFDGDDISVEGVNVLADGLSLKSHHWIV